MAMSRCETLCSRFAYSRGSTLPSPTGQPVFCLNKTVSLFASVSRFSDLLLQSLLICLLSFDLLLPPGVPSRQARRAARSRDREEVRARRPLHAFTAGLLLAILLQRPLDCKAPLFSLETASMPVPPLA